MPPEIIDSTSNKEFEKFAEGTFLSVGFLNRNSIMPIVELFNEYFEKKNKADEKTASKMVHEFDLSLKKNLDYQQQQQQYKQQQDKKNQERAERQSRAYEEQRKEMSEATKNASKGAKKALAVVAKGTEVVKDIASNSYKAQQKFTKTLQSMDSAGVFLKNGFVDITSIIQNTGWAFDDVAQLVAKSSQTIARFANTTSNGTEVLEKMYADIPNHLNITSDEFTSMATSFMKYRTNNDINNKQFQNDWKTYYNNMKLFSRVLGVSIENLVQQNNLQAQNNAVKSLQLKKPAFVEALRTMGINDEMIAAYATGGLVNSKQLALSQGNEVGRLLFKELNGKLDNMSVQDLNKIAPRLAEAAERTIEMQKNMSPSERAVATKSEEYAMLKGMNINQETLLKWAQNLKNIDQHQQILSDKQYSTTKLFEEGAGARKAQNKLEAKKLEVTAGTIEAATVTLMGIKTGYNAMNASLVAVDKTFTSFTDKLSDIISKITGIDKDKVENSINTASGFLKSALAVAVPYIGLALGGEAIKYLGKNIFSKKTPKNGPSTGNKKPQTKNTPKKVAPKAPAPNPKAPPPKAPPLKTLPKKPFLTGAAKGTGVLSAAMVLAELNAVGAEEYINRRRRPMEGLDYLDPLQYIQRGLLKIKFDKGVEWAVNKVADQFNDTEEIRTQKSKEWLIKNGYLDSSGMYLRLSNSKNTEELLKAHADKLSVPQKDVEQYHTKKIIQEDTDKRSKYIENRQVEHENTLRQILIELQKITENTDGTNKNMEKIAENDKKHSLNPIYNQR